MKKIFALLVAALLAFATSALAAKKVIAVMDVTAMTRSPIAQVAREDMYQSLVSALVQDGKYEVVERQQLGLVLRELNLHDSGLIRPDTAIEMGQMTGAQYTFIGNIVSAEVIPFKTLLGHGFKAKLKLNYKIIDNKTGRIVKSEIVHASSTVSDPQGGRRKERVLVARAVEEMAEKVLKRISTLDPLEIAIVDIDGDDIYINIGSEGGVRDNDIFLVYNLGKALIDPKSGAILGYRETLVGKVKAKTIYEHYTVCEIKDGKKRITKDCALRKVRK